MKYPIILSLALGLFLFGCDQAGQNTADKGDHQNETTHEDHGGSEAHEADHEHGSEAESELKLNNGQKWKVNAEMMVHVRTGENAVQAFGEAKGKDFKALATDLRENINLLTSSCTMTGKAHDELHVWLLPYIALVNDLEEQTEEAEAMESYHKIQSSFVTFNEFFE
jgi:hypothetical protein